MTLPDAFVLRTRALLGEDYDGLEAALQAAPVASLRMNRDKIATTPEGAEAIAWCETGYYLPQRMAFTFDPLFHAGAYYVQEASSMFLEQAIRTYVREPAVCLDLCAAPGGKSTHLCSLLPGGSLLVANEVIRSRAHILAENLTKWGNPNVIVSCNDPADVGRLTHFFDLIVADVPCSGEGMFRKDPASVGQWNLSNVNLCAARQRRILKDAWGALKPGGLLAYSTCTYNTEENEDNLAYIVETLGAEALAISTETDWGVSGALKNAGPAYRFFPHRTRGEGFFLALVRKTGDEERVGEPFRRKAAKEKRRLSPGALPAGVGSRLLHPEDFRIERCGDRIEAFPLCHQEYYRRLGETLNLVSAGLCLGEIKGKDLLPAHSLAMSRELNRDSFDAIALSREEAIQYLRKEALPLAGGSNQSLSEGHALVTYRGLPLGFVKRLGNRANNLYPQQWRIRSSHY
ncbi:MAG: RsmB/NOP family class I SAM-dependent RNA methyltransferase [Tannerellaceae bacterium]|nr:RsmB/NOP family class I SAM-dependent RNA methyltransferase [Tannerellaceae bacterium]